MTRLIATTATSEIFLEEVEGEFKVLKTLSKEGILDEGMGRHYLEGIDSDYLVKCFHSDERSQLIEFLPGPNLYSFCEQGDYLSCDKILWQVATDLHQKSNELAPRGFKTLHDLYQVFERVKCPTEYAPAVDLAKELSKTLLATQKNPIVLHGDLHHENVRRSAAGHYKAFDPKGIVGEAAYEYATILKNPWSYPSISEDRALFLERSAFFSSKTGFDQQRLMAHAYVHFCMSLLWSLEDEHPVDHQLALINMFEGISLRL